MTYGDFIIRYEHKFLRNICTNEQIENSHHIENIQNYYEIFEKFINICFGLLSMLNNYDRKDVMNYEVREFVEENFADETIHEIKNTLIQTEIKNALSSTYRKVPKFNLKIYAYVYDELVYFLKSDI